MSQFISVIRMLCFSQIHTAVRQTSLLPGTSSSPFPLAHYVSKVVTISHLWEDYSLYIYLFRKETKPQFSFIHPLLYFQQIDGCITSVLHHLSVVKMSCYFYYCTISVTNTKPGCILICSLSTRPFVNEVQQFTILDVRCNNTITTSCSCVLLISTTLHQPLLCNHKGRK